MKFKLGKNIKVGQKIKTSKGWRKVLEVREDGVFVKESFIYFGSEVFGWKIN